MKQTHFLNKKLQRKYLSSRQWINFVCAWSKFMFQIVDIFLKQLEFWDMLSNLSCSCVISFSRELNWSGMPSFGYLDNSDKPLIRSLHLFISFPKKLKWQDNLSFSLLSKDPHAEIFYLLPFQLLRVRVHEGRTHTVVGVTVLLQVQHNNYKPVRQRTQILKSMH